MKHHFTGLTLSLLFASIYGCSLINAPEDLLDPVAVGDGDGDTGGTAGDGDVGGMPGDGDGDTGGTAGDGDVVLTPPTDGLIVIAGEEPTSGDRVLLVLDSSNGAERNRETVQAVQVAYDEKPGRFVWFILTSAAVNPGANTLAELQVRRYDDDTDTWETLSKTSSLPAPLLRGNQGANPGPGITTAFRPVVLNDRLAYISQVNDGGTVQAITVLDTSDLTDVTVLESVTLPGGNNVLGLVGRRGTELDSEARGGAVTALIRGSCTGAGDPICELQAHPFSISNEVTTLDDTSFGAFQGVPAFTSTPVLPDTIDRPFKPQINSLGAYGVAFDPGPMEPRWVAFDPANPAMVSSETSILGSTSTGFSAFAVSECLAAGIAGDATQQDLRSIHMGNASVLTASPAYGDIAADILFEPFEQRALTLRTPGADLPVVRAFQIEQIGSVGNEQISLAELSQWEAPEDVDPLSFAVRLPEAANCD